MALFVCTQCGVVDETKLADFWGQYDAIRGYNPEGFAPLCSQCAPSIRSWHNKFERMNPDDVGLELCEAAGPSRFLLRYKTGMVMQEHWRTRDGNVHLHKMPRD